MEREELANNPKKLECLSISYEHILKARHQKTVTLPSLSKNVKAVQLSFSEKLVNSCCQPAGGKYSTARKLLDEDLPLCPIPPTGDYVSEFAVFLNYDL